MTDYNNHGHGNRCRTGERKPAQYTPSVRKVPAGTVPYGESISRNGRTVWAAYYGDRLVAVAATAEEARRKGREALWREVGESAEGNGQKS